MRLKSLKLFALSTTAVVPFALYSAPATADNSCSTNDNTQITTCTGNVFPYSEEIGDGDGSLRTFTFSDLTEDASSIAVYQIGSEGKNSGDNGDTTRDITVEFNGLNSSTGTTYNINSTDTTGGSYFIQSLAGRGHDGGNNHGTGSSSGHHAGDGGAAGTLTLNHNTGNISDVGDDGLFIQTTGGAGGNGGKGESDFDKGSGGQGGDGGAAGQISATFGQGQSITLQSDIGYSFLSNGGAGGEGGKGEGQTGAEGGHGGVGGAGNTIEVTFDGSATYTLPIGASQGGTGIFLQAISQGGAGGHGGAAEGTSDSSSSVTGGNGGNAGAGGTVTVQNENGELTVTTAATAITAASIGGVGGKGGNGSDTFGNAHGGDGRIGGAGGDVTVTLTLSSDGISVVSDDASGVFAKSLGGAGGEGGDGSSDTAKGKGGAADSPGDAGTVTVTINGGSIASSGEDGNAIVAQSLGGFEQSSGTGTGIVSYGSGEQSAGAGSTVTVNLGSQSLGTGAAITTSGDYSDGVLAQSIGGGGGKASSEDGLTAFAGSGSSGGDGGTVHVNIYADSTVTTSGEMSYGLQAQSIGGTGGAGGSAGGIAAFGGSGGTGGDGGQVTVYNYGSVSTTGDYAAAVLVQSVGGSGGSAHSTAGIAAFGGSGGVGGSGAQVTYHSAGDITTTQVDAPGVILQSIGGGGGHGSNAVSLSANLSVAVGGAGGNGSDGGAVYYYNVSGYTPTIQTTGDRSRGIVAASVGGGGGHGGYAVSASTGYGIDVAYGSAGSGGSGGTGSTVTVNSADTITTFGEQASGIIAQSVGGGGGSGGMTISSGNSNLGAVSVSLGASGGNGGAADQVMVTSSGSISTGGHSADGILAQSVGGGGGASGITISANEVSTGDVGVAIAGSGGSGGNAGSVTVTASGTYTVGQNPYDLSDNTAYAADGIVAQSIGGSGGNSRMVLSASGTSTGAVSVSVGESGGAGGNGETATATLTSDSGGLTVYNGSGMIVQSIGGGGGHGSTSGAGNLASTGDVAVSVGGEGGTGGTGGMVSATLQSTLTTDGDNGVGILAQSIGGVGGNGGMSVSGTGMSTGNVGVTVSGAGAAGGSADTVTVTVSGDYVSIIETAGDYGTGVKAQSIGGGGGNAIAAINGTVNSSGTAAVTVGGSGGSGGKASKVTVNNSGWITTSGDYADGIIASSIGGSGGHGALAIEGSLTSGDSFAGDAAVTIGGGGGDGGGSGDVEVTIAANSMLSSYSLSTSGYYSNGVLAQSIGGSGGYGGSVYSGNGSTAGSFNMNANVSVGGGGGTGGAAGGVTVSNGVEITTGSHFSNAIVAQSIGGDGGTGGNAVNYVATLTESSSTDLTSTVGGAGGSGNTGGAVQVTNSASLTTSGIASSGIYAQSIGGGGGTGGNAGSITYDASTGNYENNTTVNVTSTVNVGGQGGSGHHGGTVDVENYGAITINGVGYGIIAQSIGGGGGDGGWVSGQNVMVTGNGCTFSDPTGTIKCTNSSNNSSTVAASENYEIGGNGGAAGDGDQVTINNYADITTTSAASFGIFGQSIGGGGGTGGSGSTGTEQALPQNQVTSWESYAQDLVTTFYGNSSSKYSTTAIVGGSGSGGGDGGEIIFQNTATIQTSGLGADAIVLHSIGGGGGHGGTANAGFGETLAAYVGGSGGVGGDGGDVTVTGTGTLTTSGEAAMGIFVQSVGGGGGRSGTVARALTGEMGTPDLNIGKGVGYIESPGNGGDGGVVSVTVDGAITTSGDYAHGVFAHSVGGAGGAMHITAENYPSEEYVSAFVGSAGAANGDGGDVSVTVSAPISVSGLYAHGVFAQSASGTTGTDSGGNSGDLTIIVNDDITVSGTGGRGLLLQSQADKTYGTIGVTVNEGATISSAALSSDTIGIMQGALNTLTNHGTISHTETSLTTGNVLAVYNGDLTVNNYGTIEGSVSLADIDDSGTGLTNSITNFGAGSIGIGMTFDLGDPGSTLTNLGTISSATLGTIGTSSFSGSLLQTSGKLQVDINSAESTNDLINIVAGTEASLAGSVLPNFIGVPPNSGDSNSILFLTSDITLDASSLTVSDMSTVGYEISQQTVSGQEQLSLTYAVDYTPWDETGTDVSVVLNGGTSSSFPTSRNLTDNMRATGQFVEDLIALRNLDYTAGTGLLADIDAFGLSILQVETLDDLLSVYERVTSSDALRAAHAATQASLRFSDALMSCPRKDESGAVSLGDEGSCLWGEVSGLARYSAKQGNSPKSTEYGTAILGGAQIEFTEDWFAGFALGYERYNLDTSYSDGGGDRFHAGAVLKKVFGNTTLAHSFSGGVGDISLNRDYIAPISANGGSLSTDLYWYASHFRAAHKFDISNATYVEPFVDLGVTHVNKDGYTIEGGLSFDRQVSSSDATIFSVNPALRLGTEFELSQMDAKLELRGGVLALFGDDSFDATVTVAGANSASLELSDDFDQVFADLGAALEAKIGDDLTLEANTNALLGAHEQEFTGGLRLNWTF